MTLNDAVSKMLDTVNSAKEKLEGNGFTMSVETDYMDSALRNVSDVKKAKYVTVSLVIGAEGLAHGDEYCMSFGAQIFRNTVKDEQLEKNTESYCKMVDEALEILAGYENKTEGLTHLTKKAGEEYEKLMKKIEEEQKKNRKISTMINIAFIVGFVILFMIASLTR